MKCLYQYAIKRGEKNPEKFSIITGAEKISGTMSASAMPWRKICVSIVSRLNTAWLDNLMKEWEKTLAQFIQIFAQV
ncbi:unnamed protein product [Rhizophagus irregularis]|nr:unnamed protein product [Rhizophagus irregularis]